jgi:hypothetical protein
MFWFSRVIEKTIYQVGSRKHSIIAAVCLHRKGKCHCAPGNDTDRIIKMFLPGFVSGHDHLIASMWMFFGVDLYSAQSKEEYLKLIKEYVEANPDEKFILGIGWNPDIYGGAPTAVELDAIVSDRPAILLEFTVHVTTATCSGLTASRSIRIIDSDDWVELKKRYMGRID